jgi:4'-phosphopantetheinyl transferase EntD
MPPMQLSHDHVRRGLPAPVGVGIRSLAEMGREPPPLWESEAQALGTTAVHVRRLLFALGRAAARDALRQLEFEEVAIRRGAGGEPIWPPGVVGSISHSREVALAVVGRRAEYTGLGLDIEELARGPSPRAARLVCRPAELEWVAAEPGAPRLMMLFSAKEAVFKALYPIAGVWLGFADAELAWRADAGAFRARVRKSVGAGFAAGFELDVPCTVGDGWVLSVAFVPARR